MLILSIFIDRIDLTLEELCLLDILLVNQIFKSLILFYETF